MSRRSTIEWELAIVVLLLVLLALVDGVALWFWLRVLRDAVNATSDEECL